MPKPGDGCTFCEKFNQNEGPFLYVFDTVIWEDEDFVVVPALGTLNEGYCLLISRQHHTSIACFSTSLLRSCVKVKQFIGRHLVLQFGPVVFFEHGQVCRAHKAGACIDHAHLHCVPLLNDITHRIRVDHRLNKLHEFGKIATSTEQYDGSYLFFQNQAGEMYTCDGNEVRSQYFRILVAEALGLLGMWDWGVFEFESNAVRTLEKLAHIRRLPIHEE